MGSLDTAPPRYLLSRVWPAVNQNLSGLLPALFVLGLAACRATKDLIYGTIESCDDRRQFDDGWQENGGGHHKKQNYLHNDDSCDGGEVEIAGTIGAAAFQTGAIYRDMPDRGDGSYSPVLRFPSWLRADPAGGLPLPVPLPMPSDAPDQGYFPDDLIAEDRASLPSDPAPIVPRQPLPVPAILASGSPPRDHMPADISPPVDQKPPILSPDLVQPRAVSPAPITVVPLPATPVNQQAPRIILQSPLPSPHQKDKPAMNRICHRRLRRCIMSYRNQHRT